MFNKLKVCMLALLISSSLCVAQENFLCMNANEIAVYKVNRETVDSIAYGKTVSQMRKIKKYYTSFTTFKKLTGAADLLYEWNIHEEVGKILGYQHNTYSVLPDSVCHKYREKYFSILIPRVLNHKTLMTDCYMDHILAKLDEEQKKEILNCIVKISDLLMAIPEEELLGDSAYMEYPSIKLLMYHDNRILELTKKSYPEIYKNINNMEYTYALNILTKWQLSRVVHRTYLARFEEAQKIWDLLEANNMVYDLDKNTSMYQIQTYLLDLKMLEITYWDDKKMRQEARHQVKLAAPNVIKRYFSLRPKKKDDSSKQNVNYLW